ncbi:MAG: hypothetical protein F9K45_04050 [Melioribacteraceae bacterium]|nr:MAG: hypothetical protein F9K45_04050 [Melioribacteraceae bacterium]
MIEIGSKFKTEIGELLIQHFLGKGKSGYSYLSEVNNEFVILKLMHDEKSPYYHFASDKLSVEINAYNKLFDIGINLPKLLYHNLEKQFLIKEFIEGKTGAEMIAENKICEKIISQIFEMSAAAKNAGYNLDFFPTNFIIKKDKLYYIDYEINPYSEEWNLENWGIFYWANSKGFKEFLKTGNAVSINRNLEKGIPFKIPFQEQVKEWIELYTNN